MTAQYTYDVTTDRGFVRLLISDAIGLTSTPTGVAPTGIAYEDAEVDAALGRFQNNVYGAAWVLMQGLASNKAKLAKHSIAGASSEDLTKLGEEIAKQADRFRADWLKSRVSW
jgi:hypothetical protein